MRPLQVFKEKPNGFETKVQVAACYLEIDGNILLLRLPKNSSQPGFWGVPAGKLEEGENPLEAAKREFMEETGIDLPFTSFHPLGALYMRKPKLDYVYHLFRVDLNKKPRVKISEEHDKSCWASRSDLETLPLMTGAKEGLDAYFHAKTTPISQPWQAETKVDGAEALELIAEQFPELTPQKIKFLGAGWDNYAFLINNKYVFRFPRREIAVPLLEAEWAILPKLAPRLPVPIPIPKWKGEPRKRYKWPFTGYEMIPGKTACHTFLSEEVRASLAEPLALFLKALHSSPLSIVGKTLIPGDNLDRINGVSLMKKIDENLKSLGNLNLIEDPQSIQNAVSQLQRFRPPTHQTIVHGDFYIRHILLDSKNKLAGVIDWGDIHLGDPAIDLAIAHAFLPLSAHQTFIESYGPISEQTWSLAKLRAIHSSLLLLLFGHHTNDTAISREAIRSLKNCT